uniref:NADH-ubiquinone oxidoreductase chain 2 n=1 Tax=Hylurgops palliatus TaxID=202000 RepID=A0A343A5D1_9CUCU|nr:NADH dehydrogenase subunit 2 [Hylurgops palliatus]
MFYTTTILGSLISISALSWLTAWVGLEMNLMSILPLMKTKKKNSSETMIKYFLTQAIASNLLLFSIITFTNLENFHPLENISTLLSMILSSSLLLKMGAAPFHFWLPEVISGSSWKMVMILLTWQKLAPMILLANSIINLMYIYSVIITSAFIGSLMGLNQTCLRKMMAYSSINHMSWMISTLFISFNSWLIYFSIYFIINLNIIVILNKFNLFNLTQMYNFFNFNKKMKLLFMMNFLSLGGLPPFLGFLPKWTTISQLINSSSYTLTLLLILTSLISLYFYLRIGFSSLTFWTSEHLNTRPAWHKGFMLTFNNFSSLSGLLIFSILFFLM